jgi:hypothetical protein
MEFTGHIAEVGLIPTNNYIRALYEKSGFVQGKGALIPAKLGKVGIVIPVPEKPTLGEVRYVLMSLSTGKAIAELSVPFVLKGGER